MVKRVLATREVRRGVKSGRGGGSPRYAVTEKRLLPQVVASGLLLHDVGIASIISYLDGTGRYRPHVCNFL